MEEAFQAPSAVSGVWQLDILELISKHLPANTIPSVIRLVNKAAAEQFRDCTTLHLSQPSPHHVFGERWGRPDVLKAMTHSRRVDLLRLTAASGDLTNLEFAVETAGCVPTEKVFKAAAAAGHLHICKWLRNRGYSSRGAFAAAAEHGHGHVCEWFLSLGPEVTDRDKYSAVCAAARGGHVELMEQLLPLVPAGREPTWKHLLPAAAAEGCDLAMFQRMFRERMGARPAFVPADVEIRGIFAAAARSRDADWREKVEWLEAQGYESAQSLACTAVMYGPDALDRMRWLRERGHPPGFAALGTAAERGDLAVFEYLLADGCEPNTYTVEVAAMAGQLAFLQAIHRWCPLPVLAEAEAEGWEGDDPPSVGRIVRAAAAGGHLHVLEWLEELLGPLAEGLSDAAESGEVEVLSWMLARGIPWDRAFKMAVESGCEAAVEWVLQHGSPVQMGSQLYLSAAEKGNLQMMRCLQRLGCPIPQQLATQFAGGTWDTGVVVPVMRWLLEAGCPVDWPTIIPKLEAASPDGPIGREHLHALRGEFDDEYLESA